MGNLLCVTVKQGNVALKERFGRFDRRLEAGCHFVPQCFGHKIVGNLSMKTQQIDLRCEHKTNDDVFVHVTTSIHYRVAATPEAAYNAFYLLTDPVVQIQAHAFQRIKTHISQKTLAQLFETKDDIAAAINTELTADILPYGYEMINTMIVDVSPDVHHVRATNMTKAASKIAELNLTTTKEAMEMLLIQQYYDTMKDIGGTSKSSTVFMPHGSIREGFLQAPSNH